MTDEEKLTLLEIMTDEKSSTVMSAYLSLAGQIVYEKAFPYGKYPETFPAQYDGVHVEIAAYLLNKRGAEGEKVHLENGISRHWEDGGVPPSLLCRITPFAGLLTSSESEDEETENEIDETEP